MVIKQSGLQHPTQYPQATQLTPCSTIPPQQVSPLTPPSSFSEPELELENELEPEPMVGAADIEAQPDLFNDIDLDGDPLLCDFNDVFGISLDDLCS